MRTVPHAGPHAATAAPSGYARPRTLADALSLLSQGSWTVLAGGTDIFAQPAAPRGAILDISAIDALRGIRSDPEGWRIGALTSWTEIAQAELPPAFDALLLAAREVGSIQIQNRATIAGNLCNASPAADGVPPLLCLDAAVELRSADGARRLPLPDFLTGYRATARRPDELVTAIVVPRHAAEGRSGFLKLGARRYLVISIAMCAVRLVLDAAGRVSTARVAVGACSPVARRLTMLENALIGQDLREGVNLTDADLAPLSPIDDVRAPAAFRLDAVREMLRRLLARSCA